MTEKNIVNKNSEILFVYDAKMCNPNGDMDDENRPRMDKETNINLVSDVRLKRYIRDYLKIFEGKRIYVDDDAPNGKAKLDIMRKDKIEEKDLIDIRLFGAVLPKGKKEKNKEDGNEDAEDGVDEERGITGPIQFTWGYSLNKAEILESKTITSKWSDREGIGKDFRIKYSLIAFSGFVNAKTAHSNKEKGLTVEDLDLFQKAVLCSIPLMSTRSKYGQYPRLYIRVELKDDKKSLKDLREYISITKKDDGVCSIEDVELNISQLVTYLKEHEKLIEKIFWWADEKLKMHGKIGDASQNAEKLELWKDESK